MAAIDSIPMNGQVELVVGSPAFGHSAITVLAKRTYKIIPGVAAERLDVDRPLRMIDAYYDDGDPDTSTVQFESEFAPNRALTDVVVVGTAYTPNSSPMRQMNVSVAIGGRVKVLRVTGDRVCQYVPRGNPQFTDPRPFVSMPLRYERAYGGKDELSDSQIPFRYPRNDMGVGVALGGKREVIDGLRLPNIEDPADQLTPERVIIGDPKRWHLQPLPQGLGWRQRTWFPRCALLGSCPPFLDVGTVTVEERMGLLPKNYVALAKQFRLAPNHALFANGASFGMSFEHLANDALVELIGLTPNGKLAFRLPGDSPKIALDVGSDPQPLDSKLFVVSIRPDDMELDLIWAGIYMVGEFAAWSKLKNLQAEVT